MKYVIICFAFYWCGFAAVAQSAMPPLEGWKLLEEEGRYQYTPDIQLNSEFTYTVLPLAPGDNRALNDWLPEVAVRDIEASGFVVSGEVLPRKGKIRSFITWSAIIEDKLARRMAVSYMAYRKDSAAIRYGKVVTVASGTDKTHLNAAVQHFIDLSKQEGMISDGKLKNKRRKV